MKEREEKCCRKGDPFQGPKGGSGLTFRNELSEETNMLTKQKTLLGRRAQAESKRVRKPTWLKVSGFRAMGLVSRLSLANHSDSGSLLVAHKMDASEKDSGRWCLLLTFPELVWMVVAY